ncbi:MAG TPA: hypothetical protein VFU98_01430, partial [Microlunatus sp.]|nr:hypothetical protein [Microlunatus sp.]
WPVDGHTPTLPEMMALHQTGVAAVPGVPAALLDAITEALAADPADRPTAVQFRDRLAAVELGPDATVDRRSLALTAGAGHPSAGAAAVAGDARPVGVGGGHGPPAIEGSVGNGSSTHRPRRKGLPFALVLVVIVALLAAGIIYVSLTNSRSGQGAVPAAPEPSTGTTMSTAPSGRASTPSGDASPSPSAPPEGFALCPEFGAGALCPVELECWAGLQGFGDTPVVATPIDCNQTHSYQTFVAVQLENRPRTQSELERDPTLKPLCTRAVLNERLAEGRAGATWDIQKIPYRVFPDPDDVSRCLVGTGKERAEPLAMKKP